MMKSQRYQETSTFTRRPTCLQITCYLIVLSLITTFFAGLLPRLPTLASKITFGVLEGVVVVLMALSTWCTSRIDPVDPVMVLYLSGKKQELQQLVRECLYCDRCLSYVKDSSRHCKICGRCVDRFDHHCLWINNCIGFQNYNYFMVMVGSAACFCWLFVSAFSYLWSQQQWNNYTGLMVWMWICFSVALFFSVLLTILLALHLYLINKGMTTYEFIMGNSGDKGKINGKKKVNETELTFEQEQIEDHRKSNEEQMSAPRQEKIKIKIESQKSSEQSQSRRYHQAGNNKILPLDADSKVQTINLPTPEQDNRQSTQGRVRSWSLKFLGGYSLETDLPQLHDIHPPRHSLPHKRKEVESEIDINNI